MAPLRWTAFGAAIMLTALAACDRQPARPDDPVTSHAPATAAPTATAPTAAVRFDPPLAFSDTRIVVSEDAVRYAVDNGVAYVVVDEQDQHNGYQLVAIDIATASKRWSVALPPKAPVLVGASTPVLTQISGRLVVIQPWLVQV